VPSKWQSTKTKRVQLFFYYGVRPKTIFTRRGWKRLQIGIGGHYDRSQYDTNADDLLGSPIMSNTNMDTWMKPYTGDKIKLLLQVRSYNGTANPPRNYTHNTWLLSPVLAMILDRTIYRTNRSRLSSMSLLCKDPRFIRDVDILHACVGDKQVQRTVFERNESSLTSRVVPTMVKANVLSFDLDKNGHYGNPGFQFLRHNAMPSHIMQSRVCSESVVSRRV
jgi:hypothetical protein